MGLFDLFRPRITKVPMKICMMGPRAVGKTTVLTAIFNESKKSFAGSNLVLHAAGDTGARLSKQSKKLNAIFAYLDMSVGEKDRPESGLDATAYVSTFDFEFGIIGKEPRVDLQVKDFPGEYIQNKPEIVSGFIKESVAIIIAIDTPHLMEKSGKFNEVKNRVKEISDFMQTAIETTDSEKLVMLVPLKCEKYFNENRMPEVLERIKAEYSQMIDCFSKSGKVACSVTPIKTLGDVEFDDFSYINGDVRLDRDGTPANVSYRFSSTPGNKPQYKPRFCAQPLYHVLSFVAVQYKRNKANRGFIDRLLQRYSELFDSDEPLFNEVLQMEKSRLIKPEMGYVTLTGSEMFQFNK